MSPRLFLSIAGLELRKRLTYRADFWINAWVGLAIQIAVSAVLVEGVLAATGQGAFAGWTRLQFVAYFVLANFVAKVVATAEFEHAIAQDIYDGSLSRHLLYPASYALFKLAQHVGSAVPALLQAASFICWMPFAFGLPPGISWSSVAMFVPALVLAVLLQFSLIVPLQAVAFWADNVWSLMVAHRMISRFLGGVFLPLSVFPAWAQPGLEWLPYRYLFAFPVEVLLGRVGPSAWAAGMSIALAWGLLMVAITRLTWRRGDLQYTGVGI